MHRSIFIGDTTAPDLDEIMQLGKRLILRIYQQWSRRQRLSIQRRLSVTNQWPAAILFYHRVADRSSNPWTLSTNDFARHLDWIAKHATFVPLSEVQSSQKLPTRKRMTVSITFDDAYGENCEWALPELKRRGIACTYFVANAFVKSGDPFPHDAARKVALRPNTVSEIKRIADEGVEIGGHTATHLDLGKQWPRQRLLEEIRDTRHELQDWTGQAVDFFAFPYGLPANISQSAVDVVWEAGYRGFVSAYGGWNWPGEDSFHLQRIHGDPGLATLTNWLTLDPRKLKHGSQISYTLPACPETAGKLDACSTI